MSINNFDNLHQKLSQAINLLGLENNINSHQINDLLNYLQLLQKWNKVYNLTAITNSDDILVKHIIDCIAILPKLYPLDAFQQDNHLKILDVGSGAGLPSVIWAIINPNWIIHSVDAVSKKIAFQNQAKLELKLINLFPQHIRIQDFKLDEFSGLNLVTARAYADTSDIIEQTKHLLNKNGMFALLKGKDSEEFSLDKNTYNINKIAVEVPFLDAERHLVLINLII
jgi:16S rRNA (guanine527-N7)-methyltransferase